jgi:hypothetical protein
MAHSTSWGLAQEQRALSPLAKLHIADLQKRGVTAEFLDDYAAELQKSRDAFLCIMGVEE